MKKVVVIALFLLVPLTGEASLIDNLRNAISDTTSKIEQLEQEIDEYGKQLDETKKEAQTLEGAIKTLDITSRKLQTDISVTQNKISSAALTIDKLNLEINDKEENISLNKEALGRALYKLDQAENEPLVVALLRHDRLSEFWSDLNILKQFQLAMREDVQVLLGTKRELAAAVVEREGVKTDLIQYNGELKGQKQVVEITKNEKDDLLTETRSKESEYQRLLSEKLEQRAEFERELQAYEAELQVAIDPDSLPEEGQTIFRWPVEPPIRITQLFGHTHFAEQNPSVYGGRTYHPGVDFGTPVGTVIRAPLTGTVWKTGNTDAIRGCYSWGKWVLIRHNNGVSTLYAHMSLISVVEGQDLKTGELVGYTGNTGYSTGPHLHFSTYATKGVKIVPFEEIRATTRCAGAVTPAAAGNAYLDPMVYLPDNYTLDL